jgi:3-mercaptopyruvate sulfurtransferase SseA
MRIRTNREHVATVALLAVSIAAAGCDQAKANQAAGAPAAASVPMPKTDRMPMATFKSLLAKGDVVVIDVRSSDAYAGGHIPGALSIPEESITPATAEKLKRMGKPIATYCS